MKAGTLLDRKLLAILKCDLFSQRLEFIFVKKNLKSMFLFFILCWDCLEMISILFFFSLLLTKLRSVSKLIWYNGSCLNNSRKNCLVGIVHKSQVCFKGVTMGLKLTVLKYSAYMIAIVSSTEPVPYWWSCRILCILCVERYPWYDTELHLMVRLQIWRMWSTPSLLVISGPLWPGVVVPTRVPFMDQIDLFRNYY